ncbi:MAG: hypothetical protein LC722_07720 [Actinobacteria bacterium]|nr:hypothetical protein [Actinomycetota bacterium]
MVHGLPARTRLGLPGSTRLPPPELPFLGFLSALSPWIPRLLAIHAGVSLLAQATDGTYLAPGLHLPDNAFGMALAILEGLVGVWLISGIQIRWAAALLVAAGPLGMLAYGPVAIIERADLLGIALFLTVLPPGQDRFGAADPDPKRVLWAAWYLRVFVGGSLIVLAFTEKLVNPDLALRFLDKFPALNLFDLSGLHLSDAMFVRFAGAVEVLFGLLLISGAMPQAAVIVAGIPFNATLFFFGGSELIGHLPVYGAMLALLVYGSDRRTAELIPVLNPWRAEDRPVSSRPARAPRSPR